MQGKIVKGIAGFYYIYAGDKIYECKAKGIFRKEGIKPLVGDDVTLEVLNEEEGIGNIISILPRRNALIRPAVANVDQALVIFALVKPEFNSNLLDRFLIHMEKQNLPCIICLNKQDLVSEEEKESLCTAYEKTGSKLLFVSVKEAEGLQELKELLRGKTTTVAGPSGVGKSSLVNYLQPNAGMETGELSHKIERGKQTTRHTELIPIMEESYILDTPGFSSLFLPEMEKEDLAAYYHEFAEYEPECRFGGCAHISEPDCGIKRAVEAGQIPKMRYENYCQLYEELRTRKKVYR